MTGELRLKGTALTPSQQIRTQHSRTASGNRRRAAPIVLLLGVALLLSACAPRQSDTAAVVNNTVISENDVQTVSRQLSTLNQGREPFSVSNALFGLILAPFVIAESNRQRKSVTDEQVLQIIGKIPKPTPATARFVKMQLLLQQLDPASQNVVGTELGRARIVVNPRYGSYLPKQGLVQASPNWIKVNTPPAAR
jgi:hypothetical protein